MSNNLPNETTLVVSLFDHAGEQELTVKGVTPGTQIGQSYQISADTLLQRENVNNEHYFLKIPSPSTVMSQRDTVRTRVESELERGQELNELISITRKLEEEGGFRFDIPYLFNAGVIEQISSTVTFNKEYLSQFIGLPFVIYEWRDGVQLELLRADGNNDNGKINKESWTKIHNDWFKFARELADIVRRLHNHGFLHAYIVPRNILYNKNTERFSLVGFGYSSLPIDESFRPNQLIPNDLPYQAPEFNIERGLDALWYSSDIFSIGAVLFYLATGEIPKLYDTNHEFKFKKDVAGLKRYIRESLEEKNKNVISSESIEKNDIVSNIDNVAKIIDNCLRFDPDERFETVEDLIAAIEIASASTPKLRSGEKDDGKIPVKSIFKGFNDQKKAEYEAVTERISERHHYEIYGSRTKIIEGLCRVVGSLESGSTYSTVTLPSYWTQNNLGPDGRFLAMNKHAAKKAVNIRRIFLVSGEFHTLSDEEQDILNSQRLAIDSLPENLRKYLEVKVRIVRNESIVSFERSGQSVAFIGLADENGMEQKIEDIPWVNGNIQLGSFLSLNFISRGEETRRYGKSVIERQIKKVRMWDPGRSEVYWKRLQTESRDFSEKLHQSSIYTLNRYIDGSTGPKLEDLLERGKRKSN